MQRKSDIRKKLKLEGYLLGDQHLTMDEYYKFVLSNLKNVRSVRDRNAGRDKYDFKVRFKL